MSGSLQLPDASIPAQIQPIQPPPNPFAQLGQMAQTQNALLQLQGNQQTMAARQATGDAYQQAINPTTGALDTNKLMAIIGSDPRAAYTAGDVAAGIQNRAAQQLQMNGEQLNQQTQKLGYLGSLLGGTLNGPINQNVIAGKINQAVTDGVLPNQLAGQLMQSVPPDTDPVAQRNWVVGHAVSTAQDLAATQAQMGTYSLADSGGSLNVIHNSPLGGGITATGQTLTKTPDPGALLPYGHLTAAERTDLVSVTGTGGVTYQVPRAYLLSSQGGVSPQSGEGFPNGGRLPPAAGGDLSSIPPASVTATPAGITTPSGLPAVGMSQSTADQAANTAMGTASANQATQLSQTADNVPVRKAALGDMLAELQTAPTGPGMVAGMHSLAGINAAFGTHFQSQDIAAQEGFKKLGSQIALAQTAALGAGTDEKLSTALGANPNAELSKLGNTQIINVLQGNEDAIAAKNQAWQQWLATGHGASTYGQFTNTFNQNFDPRVFQAQYMDPAQKASLAASLKDSKGNATPDGVRFVNAMRFAQQQGWLNPQATANGN